MAAELPVQRGTILCLVNAAAYSRSYFEQLGERLKARGFSVAFALDSHLSDILYADDRELPGGWYFSDYAQRHAGKGTSDATVAPERWASLFSDFDRFLTMDIRPPLQKAGLLRYSEVPGLLARFFAEIFASTKPVAVLYESVSNSFAIAAYRQAELAGVPFCSISPSRIPGRIELSMTGALRDHETIGEIYRSGAVTPESREIARNYVASIDRQVPDYMKTNGLDRLGLLSKYAKAGKIAHFARGWKYRRRMPRDCEFAYQHGDPVALSIAYFKRSLMRRLRARSVMRLYGTEIRDEQFFIYPLHFHPESSTSVWAADYVDELSVIKAIAFRLPVNVRLYVKEHPSAIALQPVSFYRQLKEMPNVELLAPNLPTKEIIRRSKGVVCLTSTAGFEGAVMNRPVIIFGNIFYSYFPNVRTVRDYSQLTEALDWALAYQPLASEELVEATAAYVQFGKPGKFDFQGSLGDLEALDSVADLVAESL